MSNVNGRVGYYNS